MDKQICIVYHAYGNPEVKTILGVWEYSKLEDAFKHGKEWCKKNMRDPIGLHAILTKLNQQAQ